MTSLRHTVFILVLVCVVLHCECVSRRRTSSYTAARRRITSVRTTSRTVRTTSRVSGSTVTQGGGKNLGLGWKIVIVLSCGVGILVLYCICIRINKDKEEMPMKQQVRYDPVEGDKSGDMFDEYERAGELIKPSENLPVPDYPKNVTFGTATPYPPTYNEILGPNMPTDPTPYPPSLPVGVSAEYPFATGGPQDPYNAPSAPGRVDYSTADATNTEQYNAPSAPGCVDYSTADASQY